MKTPLATNQTEMSVVENSAFTNGDLVFLQEFGVPPMVFSRWLAAHCSGGRAPSF